MRILIVNQHIDDVIGGSERQCDLIAKYLLEFGHEIFYGAINGTKDKYDTPYKVIPINNFSYYSFDKIFSEVNPDVIYWRYNRKYLFKVGIICKVKKYKMVFAVSSLNDVTKRKFLFSSIDEKGLKFLKKVLSTLKHTILDRLNYFGYKFVDGVVLQKKDTLDSVPNNIKENNKIHIYNSMEVANNNRFTWNKPYIIWVANIKSGKNPEKVLKIAKKIKENNINIDILMVGKIQDDSYNKMFLRDNLPSNVHYLGPKTVSEVDSIIANSLFLIHTCNPEGLPNNLIQSWLLGKPTISLYYDPDQLIETHQLGFLSKTEEKMVEQITILVENNDLRNRIGSNAQKIAKKLFDPKTNIRKLEKFLLEI